MASVTLSGLWVHQAADPDTYVVLDDGTVSEQTTVAGGTRRYANGRVRSITSAGHARIVVYRSELAERDDYLTLRSWVDEGIELLVRDPVGGVEWGNVYEIDGDPVPGNAEGYTNVSFTLETVTHSEIA